MAKKLQMTVGKVPRTLPPLGTWLEDYLHKQDHGMILGVMLEPRTVITMVKDTMETIAYNDDIL
eukprot:8912807-Prorocentrum_lima.AAC.1